MIYGKNELLGLFIILHREKQWKIGNMALKPGKKFWPDIELRFWGKWEDSLEARSFWSKYTQVMCSAVFFSLL